MRFILGLCFLASLPLNADTIFTTRVHDIDSGLAPDDQVLILLANGKVARMNHNQMNVVDDLFAAKQRDALLKITLNDAREIIAYEEAQEPVVLEVSNTLVESEEKSIHYTPSVISSPEVALRIFRDRQYNAKESQCYNRAHIWSYEWRVKHNLYSSKIWVFFTRKFLREYPSFEWWFHVAPMVYVNDGGVKERAMDMKYNSRPMPIQKWADTFLKGKGPCLTVQKYSEHINYPYNGHCYFQKSSMYYYQPADLEFIEKFGTEKNAWVETEVREAYREAFDII